MKTKKLIITISVVVIVISAIAFRLAENKQQLEKELNSVSEFSTVVPVLVDTVKGSNVADGFSINGSFNAMSEVSVVSETQGKVTGIFASAGMGVKAGQALASTDRELITSQLELAKASYEKAEKDLKRFELLSKNDAASLQQLEAAKLAYLNAQSAYIAAQKQFDNSTLKAPVSGIVTKRMIEKGTYLAPGMAAFDIVEIDRVKFIARMTSDEVSKIKLSDEVKVHADAITGSEFMGRVSSTGVKADDSKRYEVEVEVKNGTSANKIMPGMYGTAYFDIKPADNKLVIKRRALTGSIKNPEVYVLSGDAVQRRSITAETINDEYLAVKSGLKQGEVVVVSGQINLKDGAKVKVIR